MIDKLERFKKAYDVLLLMGLFNTQAEFSEKLGANQVTVSRALRGHPGYLTDKILRRVNESFDNVFSEDWLLHGSGYMLNSSYYYLEEIKRLKDENSKLESELLEAYKKIIELYESAYDPTKK